MTIVTASDFARTLTSNGLGTDHAWGGNVWLAGGALKGGKIFGEYPDDLSDDGKQNVGRGRLIPTTPWEGMWSGIAKWMGIVDGDKGLDYVLPNLKNFGSEHIIHVEDLYDS